MLSWLYYLLVGDKWGGYRETRGCEGASEGGESDDSGWNKY